MIHPRRQFDSLHCEDRSAFTLVELLVVIMIIVLLASMVLFAMAGVQQKAREDRTRAQISRLHELIMEAWESYQTRRAPVPVGVPPSAAAMLRLNAIRELMRMELPDRITDVLDDPVVPGLARTSLSRAYLRRALKGWTQRYQGAECLYMIVSQIQVGNSNGLEFFSQSELGDVDGDGMPEILDGWGNPIEFLRWAPGFWSPLQDHNMPGGAPLPANSVVASGGDVFDPTGADLRTSLYPLYPLIFSAGPDGQYDIVTDQRSTGQQFQYKTTNPPNDPYAVPDPGDPLSQFGAKIDARGDGEDNSIDNIHSHLIAGT